MRSDPNVQLLKTLLQRLLELLEKLAMLRHIRHIHEIPRKVVLINSAFLFPRSPQDLRFPRGGASACEIIPTPGFDVALAIGRFLIFLPPECVSFVQARFVVNQFERAAIFR